MNKPTKSSSYATAGVDEEREQITFSKLMRPWLEQTSPASEFVESLHGLAAGHFASVMSLAGGGSIAVTTDGVGTKILVARMARRYDSVGVDCVANNVNDLICLGADPVLLVDYIAIDRVDEEVLEQLARGLFEGAKEAGVAIPGGEIAQVGELLASDPDHGPVFDLVGTAIGVLPPGKRPIDGSAVSPGDVIIGLPSSGLHSNGYSLARHALFGAGGLALDHVVAETGRTLGEELLEPTRIYVPAVRALWHAGAPIHGLVNISGGGLLNLARLRADVSYEVDGLPPAPPIFELIQACAGIADSEMYSTFNMGIGACLVVPADAESKVTDVLASAGESPVVIGNVRAEGGRRVKISALSLVGEGDRFGYRRD